MRVQPTVRDMHPRPIEDLANPRSLMTKRVYDLSRDPDQTFEGLDWFQAAAHLSTNCLQGNIQVGLIQEG